jgi:hypothetical protein
MSAWLSLLRRWGRFWARVEGAASRLVSWLARGRRRLGARGRLLGAEVRQIGVQVWDRVDDLPVVGSSRKLTPIRTQFYGHGAFMGAAPALLADPKWRRILAFLMPDVLDELRVALAGGGGPGAVIPMLENNPVMAAFGVFRGAATKREGGAESPHHLTGLEWDVFVDADLVEAWEATGASDARTAVMERIVDTSLIAHASSADTVQEAMGLCQYRDVRKTRKTAMGGVEMDAWLDLFARSLVLARADDLTAAVEAMAREPRHDGDDEEACMKHTFRSPWPVRRAVEVHREVTGKPALSIILEIKSLRSTPAFLSDLVRTLNAHGVHVAAVASFLRDEVDGVGQTAQVLDGVTLPGPRELQFFHFAGDLQAACDAGSLPRGASVLFNGASLLDVVQAGAGTPVYSSKLQVIAELDDYRIKHDLLIGFYVQEGDCDHAAVALLSDLCEAFPETFELGFAWGGLRDEASLPASSEAHLGYGSQKMLEYVGRARQWQVRVYDGAQRP